MKKYLPKYNLLKPPSGRFEIISSKNITAIVDYAHTPDALLNVLSTINQVNINKSKVITVIGCGGGRDMKKRKNGFNSCKS